MKISRAIPLASLLLALPAQAHFAPPLLHAVMGQMSFDGLDLSGDKKKDKKAKDNKKPKKEDKKTPEPAVTPAVPLDLGTAATPEPKKEDRKSDPKPAKPPEAAPTMSFDAIDVTGRSAERQRIEAANALFKKGEFVESALALDEILKDQKAADLHLESKYLLGKSLYKLGLYHSSLQQFHEVLAAGAQSKVFKSSLEWLFFIAHKTVNEEIILDEVAKYSNYEFPAKFQSEFKYLLARYHFNRGRALLEVGDAKATEDGKREIFEAGKLVSGFPLTDPFYAKAKYIEGLDRVASGEDATALESFKEVIRFNNPRSNPKWDPELRELAFMQLARLHYGSRQNRYAVFYFNKIGAGSDQWLESLFESSWAHFRIGQYEKALGNMVTLQAPFFRDEYFPEALILRAVIYYENCRYKEARSILDDFEKAYSPVRDELERIVKEGDAKGGDAKQYFEVLEEFERRSQSGEPNALVLGRVLKLALSDKDLKATNDSINEIDAELDALGTKPETFRYSDVAKRLDESLKKERAHLIGKAGLIAKAKLTLELEYLTSLLSQALRIQFETSSKEKEFLEASLTNEAKREELSGYRYSVAVGDDEEYWPYEGEYWRDELGTYEYTLTKGCRGDSKKE